jgi:ABC-2 type transport system permease protein
MGASHRYGKYIKFITYLVTIVLINVVGISLYTRIDLTANKAYSISAVSKKVVATLTEPLTIKVFFTRDLPAPHNTTEQYLRDLLEEYALYADRHFNYSFYDVSPENAGPNQPAMGNRKLAGDYGIYPVQIQIVENDEIKFKNAYMGLVLIHGDVIERIPTLTSTAGLEYKLTTAIQKLNNKISALLALKEKVNVKLFLSASLNAVAPYMGLEGLARLPQQIEAVVKKMNRKNYDKLQFEHLAPASVAEQNTLSRQYNIQALEWPAITDAGIAAGQGIIGLVMEYGAKTTQLPLLNVINLPILGTRYSLVEAEQLEETVNKTLESLIDINQDIGLLASHGTLGAAPAGRQQRAGGINNFRTMVAENYAIKPVDLKKDTIPASLQSLVIARPTETFSDYDLYQIDQALMRGTNLVIFMDTFKEEMPAQQGFGLNRGPVYTPLDTGLEKLLAHYGIVLEKAYVLDENCYKQRVSQAMGGGERNIYFAPIIKSRHINRDLTFMQNIKGLIVVKASPVTLDEKLTGKAGMSAHKLLASSEKSWEMRENINLNPMFLAPPGPAQGQGSQPLAWLLEGEFSSYFAGRQIPVKTAEAKTNPEKPAADKSPGADLSMIQGRGDFIEKGTPARIFIMASAEMIKDNVLDPNESTPNGLFVLNVIDALNNRADIAVMRAKVQQYNPLDDIQPPTRTAIKMLNIAGLPIAVTVFGFFILLRRHARKKRIQMMFPAKSN